MSQLSTVISDNESEVDQAELGIISDYSASDPYLTDTDFAHMYRITINHHNYTQQHLTFHYNEMMERICSKIKRNNINNCQSDLMEWMFPSGGPAPRCPQLVAMTSAYLAHTGYTKKDIRKVITFPDSSRSYWALIHLELPTSKYMSGAATDLHHFFHFTSKAGIYGITSNLKDWMLSPEEQRDTIPLKQPIILPTQGKDRSGSDYLGAHGLFYVDQQDVESNCTERRHVVDMANNFGKNYMNMAIYAQVHGVRKKINGGGSDAAQDELKIGKDGLVVANVGSRKACIKASHIVPSGILIKLDSSPPTGWSASHPLRLT